MVKNNDGLAYIEIVQTIIHSKYRDSSIKINPTVLPDIIKDLATLFDQNAELIEMVLRNKDIEIVEDKMPKPRFWAKNYKKRKE